MLQSLLLRIYKHLALNSFVSGEMEKAERYFEKCLKIRPDAFGLRYNLAIAKMGLGKFGEAENVLQAILVEKGGNQQLYRTLADLHYLSGKRGDALRYYGLCLENGREQSLVAIRHSICSSETSFENAVRAMRLYEEGRELSDLDPDAAFDLLLQAVTLDLSHYPALNNLGALFMNNRRDLLRAKHCFERSLALSDQPLVRRNLKILSGLVK